MTALVYPREKLPLLLMLMALVMPKSNYLLAKIMPKTIKFLNVFKVFMLILKVDVILLQLRN
jgi:hypothetical protein